MATTKTETAATMSALDILKQAQSASRTLLYGPPGTGKNHLAGELAQYFKVPIYSVTINTETSPLQLLGFWGLRGGETVFIPGPATRALEEGAILLLNEISDTPQSIETLLMSLLDDPKTICSVPIPDGRLLKPASGYRVIATMNGEPDELREALVNRFDLILKVNRPSDQAIKSMFKEDSNLATYAANWFAHNMGGLGTQGHPRPISTRTLLAFQNLRHELGDQTAATLIFGSSQAQDFLNALTLLKGE